MPTRSRLPTLRQVLRSAEAPVRELDPPRGTGRTERSAAFVVELGLVPTDLTDLHPGGGVEPLRTTLSH